MTTPAIEIEGVSLALRGVPVLTDIDLRLEPNGYLAILGPNGGGKTTLLKLILGLLAPDRGRIRVSGQPPSRSRGRVGYVPQIVRFDLDFPIRVLDLVLMGRLGPRRLFRRFGPRDRAVARAKLAQVELEAYADRPVGTLSGGQLQRALIARALALEPEILLLDEPTASLDERVGRSVWELFGELSREMAVVLVSHDIGAISQHVRSVACLNRRLYYHPSKGLTAEMLEATYGCPVDLLAHGHPHRVLPPHGEPAGGV
ncbi:MAG: metal ABC transporter ATP-binding protein [Deltaproteobacteria bacterium]|nr:MAG: metal ABC transporter ATP-binding protein [Deltaproteobacteria bacterium]